jgi:hypothetical protein
MELTIDKEREKKLLEELKALDTNSIEVDGKVYKPSQCYHWEANPTHLLYNTNCPPDLKQRLESIISKYVSGNETRQ